MPINVAYILGLILALAGTIVSVILITPEKRRAVLPKFFQFVHDVFNFKFLILEKILKFLYIFSTLFTILTGFFMLFSGYETYSYYGGSDFHSVALEGLLVMILGPVLIRIVYEFMMMTILLVKNVIQLNNKTKNQNEGTEQSSIFNAQPMFTQQTAPAPVAEDWKFCTSCGNRYDRNRGGCPNCGNK